MNTLVDEGKITGGIAEFDKFKALAQEAVQRCREAEEKANYFRGQFELADQQHKADVAQHRSDTLRIAELEAFIGHITDLYNAAAEKLRLGAFRRATSSPQPKEHQQDLALRVEAELQRSIRNDPIAPMRAIP
jgi:hypothetical protein